MRAHPFALLLAVAAVAAPWAQAAPAHLAPLDPAEGATVHSLTPNLRVALSDPDGDLDRDSLQFILNGDDIAQSLPEEIRINATDVSFQVPSILPLREGNQTLEVRVRDATGTESELLIHFHATAAPPPSGGSGGFSLAVAVTVVVAFVGLAAVGLATLYVWLRRTRRFTLRKFFLRNPKQVRLLVLYVPAGLAGAVTLVALAYVALNGAPFEFGTELVLVGGGFLAVAPFALDVQRAERRRLVQDRAFAQFLFELADALRGGIDPMKAVIELSKTDDGILGRPLRAAADNIRLGQPFDVVMKSLVADIGSPLVKRYAQLVGEAASMGGGIAAVIHRAAQDMDELVKIDSERRQKMRTPVFTMYTAYGVLLLMVLQLMRFAPSLGSIDAGSFFGGVAEVPRLEYATLKSRFFHLVLINSLGAGLLIGSFQKGSLRHGLVHALLMVGLAAAVYVGAV